METTINKLLENQEENHILPFLWVHGEAHEVYRKTVRAVYDAEVRAFWVEARPHKAFAKQQWGKMWRSFGGVEKAPLERLWQHICHRRIPARGGARIRLNLARLIHPREYYNAVAWIMLLYGNNMRLSQKYDDDRLLSCTA